MIEYLKGKKTYIVTAIGVILTGAYGMGLIDDQIYQAVLAILGFLGLAAVRDGISNSK